MGRRRRRIAAAIQLLIERGADIKARSNPAPRGRGPALGKANDPRKAVAAQGAALAAEQAAPDLGALNALDAAGGRRRPAVAAARRRGGGAGGAARRRRDGAAGDDQDDAAAAAGFGAAARRRATAAR